MAIDRSKYISKFAEEAAENIQTVESLLFEIRDGDGAAGGAGSGVSSDFTKLMRALHTMKGSARMLEFTHIEGIAHSLESVFASLEEERVHFNDNAVRLVLCAIDEIKEGINKVKHGESDDIRSGLFQKELSALCANEEFNLPPGSAGAASPQAAMTADSDVDFAGGDRSEEAKSESIRIALEKIDGIIHNMAALQSLEIAARNIAKDTEALNTAARQVSRLSKNELAWNSPLLAEFRSMEIAAVKLGSLVKNYALDAGNHIRSAYDSVISLRMLPLSTILDAYPRYVFNISSELGKRVRLTVEGAENEIDKNIIELLSDVFIHMIRNSIDHGIETQEERAAAGKKESASLLIRCVRESGSMKVTISDDGRGIDTEKIRKKIGETGLVSKEVAAAASEAELINFIFQSGFSTKDDATDISGRGVGMDAVKNNIERMKGSITVQNKPGEGAVFTISVPLSLASLMGFPITCGHMKFIIPANFVDTVLLIDTKEIITIVDRPGIKFNGRIIKLFYLHHILKIGIDEKKTAQGPSIFVAIVHAYEETIAIAVNEINSMRQVILKNMPSFMERMAVFSGLVLSEDYEMIPALHIPTIIKMARRTKTIDMKKRHVDYERTRKSILVVDDSLPTRDIVRDIFEAEGYKVGTAADGSEALAAAKSAHYDLICTDLVMPNMDGFLLTENIRKNETLKDIPIIVVSSRVDNEDKNRAAALGANRYMDKSSFNDHHLVAAVRQLIGEANE
ncbi:MAG: response regulator [Spirochaetes bacterium]|nr:response regulator [Spirochaetota bacterium]